MHLTGYFGCSQHGVLILNRIVLIFEGCGGIKRSVNGMFGKYFFR